MESTTGAAETLSSNRHPTARSPVSAGHKRITDTLPTVNPRLRAPLPPAAIAPARAAHRHASRRVPGRHPRRDFSSSVLHSRGHHSPSPGVKDNRKTTKNTSTGVSRQSRLYCGDAAAVRTLRWQHSSPRRPPPLQPSSSYRAPGSRGPFAGSCGGRRSVDAPLPKVALAPSGSFVTVAQRKAGSARRGAP